MKNAMKNDKLDEWIRGTLQNLSAKDKAKLRGNDTTVSAADPDDVTSPGFEQKLFERIDRYEAEKAAEAELETKGRALPAAAFLYLPKRK